MAIGVDAVYEDGVLKLEHPVDLEDRTKVHVVIEAAAGPSAVDDDDPTGWKAARRFIGMWKAAPGRGESSLSEDHDEVLYKHR